MTDTKKEVLKHLYNYYYDKLLKQAKKCLFLNNNQIPLEEEDIATYSLFEFMNRYFFEFDPTKEIKFEAYFFIKTKHIMLNYCHFYMTKKENISNNYIEYNDDFLYNQKKDIHLDFSNLTFFEKNIIEKIYFEEVKFSTICKEFQMSSTTLKKTLNRIYNKMKSNSYFL